jgi:hypothetical protein
MSDCGTITRRSHPVTLLGIGAVQPDFRLHEYFMLPTRPQNYKEFKNIVLLVDGACSPMPSPLLAGFPILGPIIPAIGKPANCNRMVWTYSVNA